MEVRQSIRPGVVVGRLLLVRAERCLYLPGQILIRFPIIPVNNNVQSGLSSVNRGAQIDLRPPKNSPRRTGCQRSL